MERTRSLSIVVVHDTNKSTSEYDYDCAYLAMQKLYEFLSAEERESFIRWMGGF